MESGCSEIHACAIANGCQDDFCLIENCSQEIGDAGGPESDAANRAIGVTVCGAFNDCECVELASSATSCTGTEPDPVAEVACDPPPTCSSTNGQYCCLDTGCVGTTSACSTTSVYCDGPEDCTPGQLCCGTASAAGSYDSLACEWSSFGCNRMCNVGNDSECDSGEVCTQSSALPSGVGFCSLPESQSGASGLAFDDPEWRIVEK
jgi:hypothetical protein